MVKKFKHRCCRYCRKDILVLGEDPSDCFDDTTIRAEVKYSVNMTRSKKKICSSLQYDVSKSFLYVDGVKIYQFKTKDFEIK